jgi:hypothetical protein
VRVCVCVCARAVFAADGTRFTVVEYRLLNRGLLAADNEAHVLLSTKTQFFAVSIICVTFKVKKIASESVERTNNVRLRDSKSRHVVKVELKKWRIPRPFVACA